MHDKWVVLDVALSGGVKSILQKLNLFGLESDSDTFASLYEGVFLQLAEVASVHTVEDSLDGEPAVIAAFPAKPLLHLLGHILNRVR